MELIRNNEKCCKKIYFTGITSCLSGHRYFNHAFVTIVEGCQEKTKLAVCMNNLKQIGFEQLYGQKMINDCMVSDGAKVGSLKPYTGTDRGITQPSFSGLYHCPSLTQDRHLIINTLLMR